MASDPSRKPLPFEPRQKKKKPPQRSPIPSQTRPATPVKKDKNEASLKAIPAAVSQRMVRRMALFSGLPTVLGMSSFAIFYWIVSHEWFKVPTYVVAAVSLSLFGLGVVGLSYGIFSASWDEDRAGGWWGWQEFTANFGRTVSAWRTARKEARENS